jgi:hypothetical protein
MRGITYAIQNSFLPEHNGPLSTAPTKKHVRGVGMSDGISYASQLERVFDYTNTYYHTDPQLDITSAHSCGSYRDLDFIISSDVLEHVAPPVSTTLVNMRGMLKKGGILFLTAPYVEGYETIEHYPQLHKYNIVNSHNEYAVLNETRSGEIELHRNPVFHGGPGSVLELRIFGEGDLLSMLRWASFQPEVLEANIPQVGYYWQPHLEGRRSQQRRLKAYVLMCHAA